MSMLRSESTALKYLPDCYHQRRESSERDCCDLNGWP
jgi:hypothetical protein